MKRFSSVVWRLIGCCLCLVLCGCGVENVKLVGEGSYLAVPPRHATLPLNADRSPAIPVTTADLDKPVVTNKWWSSLVWPHNGPFSADMYAHPLVLRADSGGLWVRYPSGFEVSNQRYFQPDVNDLHAGLAEFSAPHAALDDYGDWTVTAAWESETDTLRATFGRGLPFVWLESISGAAQVRPRAGASVLVQGTRAIIDVDDRRYALFVPTGHSWFEKGQTVNSTAASFAVALLPDEHPETLASFEEVAFNVVRDSRVTWEYLQADAMVRSSFLLETEPLAGQGTHGGPTVLALYRHQWLNARRLATPYAFKSPRGEMKALVTTGFTTEISFDGVLPRLPDLCNTPDARLAELVQETVEANDAFDGLRAQPDAYWSGKAMGRLAELISLAGIVGNDEAERTWTEQLSNTLESWLSVGDAKRYFYYDPGWSTLLAHPASFGSDTDLNDHHFHYGYLVQAGATLARLDPGWIERWGDMVELLISDTANHDREDTRFPFLRTFDPYAGHSLANGHGNKIGGYDQESSSESMNFSIGVIRWALETGDRELLDLGIWMYTTERTAVEQYWFDVDDVVFPEDFAHTTAGIVWGRGAMYDTWWSREPEFIHGINYLPLTAGSYYLGRHPDYIRRNDAELRDRKPVLEHWLDLSTMFFALADPEGAAQRFQTFRDNYEPEAGGSRPHTHHWLSVLSDLGRVDTTVTAGTPSYGVFGKNGRTAYVVYNPTPEPSTARFSDGTEIQVPGRKQITVCL